MKRDDKCATGGLNTSADGWCQESPRPLEIYKSTYRQPITSTSSRVKDNMKSLRGMNKSSFNNI